MFGASNDRPCCLTTRGTARTFASPDAPFRQPATPCGPHAEFTGKPAMSARPAAAKVYSRPLIAALAALTLQCGGGDGGGVTPPTDPTIGLETATATFSATAGAAAPAAQSIHITNTGGGTLDGLSTSVSYSAGPATGWLTASLDAPQAPSTLTLTVASGSLAAGSYTALV